jgi:3',5'-cyclic-AMP phosphodiesterase
MKPLRLVQITDTHLFGEESGDLRGVATLPALRAVLEAAGDDLASADAVLVTGDVVQDDPRGYAPFRAEFAGLGLPVLCIPGNHDDVPRMCAALRGAPFWVGGHVDFGAWRIVLLDSVLAGQAGGRLSPHELGSLDRALSGAGTRHALVCLHHHPVPMSSRWLDAVGLENGADFFRVIDRHPAVRGIVWGHVHQAFDAMRGAVRLLSAPSTCAQFEPGRDEFAVDTRPPGYRILELGADGAIRTEVVWVDRFAAGLRKPSPQSSSSSAA